MDTAAYREGTSLFPCEYPTCLVSPSTGGWGCCVAMTCLHTWGREGTAATCCSPLSARYLWSSISTVAEQLALLISHLLGQCLNLPFHFLGAQQYSQAWRWKCLTGWSRVGPCWRRLCLHILPSISATGGGNVLCTLAEWFCRSPCGLWNQSVLLKLTLALATDWLAGWFDLIYQHRWCWQHMCVCVGKISRNNYKISYLNDQVFSE